MSDHKLTDAETFQLSHFDLGFVGKVFGLSAQRMAEIGRELDEYAKDLSGGEAGRSEPPSGPASDRTYQSLTEAQKELHEENVRRFLLSELSLSEYEQNWLRINGRVSPAGKDAPWAWPMYQGAKVRTAADCVPSSAYSLTVIGPDGKVPLGTLMVAALVDSVKADRDAAFKVVHDAHYGPEDISELRRMLDAEKLPRNVHVRAKSATTNEAPTAASDGYSTAIPEHAHSAICWVTTPEKPSPIHAAEAAVFLAVLTKVLSASFLEDFLSEASPKSCLVYEELNDNQAPSKNRVGYSAPDGGRLCETAPPDLRGKALVWKVISVLLEGETATVSVSDLATAGFSLVVEGLAKWCADNNLLVAYSVCWTDGYVTFSWPKQQPIKIAPRVLIHM